MRFYGFGVDEIVGVGGSGMLDLEIDPKLAWALKNRQFFPLDVNSAAKELLLPVPGFGTKTVMRVLQARRSTNLRYEDMVRMGAIMSKAKSFVALQDWHPGKLTDDQNLRSKFAPPAEQLQLFA